MTPVSQIQLLAEHTVIEKRPVLFLKGDVNLWMPLSAEVHFVGEEQVHRRHSFDHYMLFAVDDKQRISMPPVL